MEEKADPEDWWEQRLSIPQAFGHTDIQQRPASSGMVKVAGDRHRVFHVAALAVGYFEESVFNHAHPDMSLQDMAVREKATILYHSIPLCPSPKTVKAEEVPERFRSLAVKIDKDLLGEIWFVVRITITNSGFSWHLDWSVRKKLKAVMVVADSAHAFVSGFFGGTSEGGPSESWDETAQNKAMEYLPTISELWVDALEAVNRVLRNGHEPPVGMPITSVQGLQEQPDRRD